MGRGRQKAKQQKIARKLKYLTTDTDYDELAKELNAHELEQESVDPRETTENYEGSGEYLDNEDTTSSTQYEAVDDDLDEYAKWAAESAAKAMNSEKTSSSSNTHTAIHHHIPMPVPNFMHKSEK